VVAAFVLCAVIASAAVEVGRPALHNKLLARRMALGDSAVAAATEKLESLRVAAAERSHSLADKFAADLDAHVAAKDAAADEAEAEESADSEEAAASAGAADSSGALSFEALAALEFAIRPPAAAAPAPARSLASAKTQWGSCLVNSDKAAGTTALTDVSFKAAPPMRTDSFLVNIDGNYKGPDVQSGSMTVQIQRKEKAGPVLVYRHSVRLSDVLGHATSYPFKTGDPFTTAIYVPSSAFDMMAKEGDHTLTAVFTNQDKQPFACARLDFSLA